METEAASGSGQPDPGPSTSSGHLAQTRKRRISADYIQKPLTTSSSDLSRSTDEYLPPRNQEESESSDDSDDSDSAKTPTKKSPIKKTSARKSPIKKTPTKKVSLISIY